MARETEDGAILSALRTTSLTNVANVTAATTVQTLFAANPKRVDAQLKNDSTATLYVKLGSGASLTSYSEDVPPGAIWRLAPGNAIYTGIITGIWTAVGGAAAARTTEMVTA